MSEGNEKGNGSEDREEFLHSILRHDLRNKLQIIRGYHELLSEMDLPEEAEKYVKKASNASEDGAELIESVRTLREMDESETKLEPTPIDPILEDIAEQHSSEDMSVDYIPNEYSVYAGRLLPQAFDNIVGNSVKHSGGDKMWIHAESEDDEVAVVFEDDGKGISEKDKIFEEGYKKGESGGSGLGMYIVKEIVSLYDGDIEVLDSEKLGGARFDVYLIKT